MLTHCCSPCLGSSQTRSGWHTKAACATTHTVVLGHRAEAAECLNTNSPLRQRPAMHGCFWRTQLLVFAGYLQGTVQAFALQLYHTLDLRESKILLSTQFFSQKEHFSCRCQECKTKPSDWCPAALVKEAWTRQSLFYCTEKMLPQSCWLVRAATWGGGDGASASPSCVPTAKRSDLKPWITGQMGCPSSSCWHCPTLHEELLRTAGIQPLSSHSPGPSDCSLSIESTAGMVQ